ncbi:nucleoside-diphosphate-sugar epimerase [Pochonia chlamydosporia 170]|uniref:Nucleoside-diphosphate-sugar epimerase n=1 Tax=Pochonia chlamydosporia 170 TaxID=1380566 RepID=A0A179FW81_METCM|nr:nucleoside-diphosphate-sugar epimerase [Pochonia chlamydosporia 170]OAQ69627.1 nucleoside-diphosphate-sugar epimerase [Pochonia chlamydosporia 170]
MKILVTGASGYIGQVLSEALLKDGHSLTLADVVQPDIPSGASTSNNQPTCVKVDLFEDAESVISPDLDAIYILHGIMSAGSEEDIDLGYRVNVHSVLKLLEAVRKICRPGVRVLYTSSIAAYGSPLPDIPSEATVCTPQTSYGTHKIMVEAMLNDYNRRGFISAFSFRLAGISVRGGKPTRAASSWMSGIIREPLRGLEAVIPCDDDFKCWICSPKTLVKNLIIALTLPTNCLPPHIRQVLLPGIVVTVREMLQALQDIGGQDALKLVRREEPTPDIRNMLNSWPTQFDVSKALALGFVPDQPFRDTVQDFADSLKFQTSI